MSGEESRGCPQCGATVSYAGRGRRPVWCSSRCRNIAAVTRRGAREAAVQIRMIDVPRAPKPRPERTPTQEERDESAISRVARSSGSPGSSSSDCRAVGSAASSTARSGATSRRCSISSSSATRRGSHRRRQDRRLPPHLRSRPLCPNSSKPSTDSRPASSPVGSTTATSPPSGRLLSGSVTPGSAVPRARYASGGRPRCGAGVTYADERMGLDAWMTARGHEHRLGCRAWGHDSGRVDSGEGTSDARRPCVSL